jgi:hypothetical protein
MWGWIKKLLFIKMEEIIAYVVSINPVEINQYYKKERGVLLK